MESTHYFPITAESNFMKMKQLDLRILSLSNVKKKRKKERGSLEHPAVGNSLHCNVSSGCKYCNNNFFIIEDVSAGGNSTIPGIQVSLSVGLEVNLCYLPLVRKSLLNYFL